MENPNSFNIDDFRGEARLLLIFAPSVKSPAFETQMRLLDGAGQAFEERNLIEVALLGEGKGYCGDQMVNEADSAQLRQQFGVGEDDFRVVLVGVDGAEKYCYEAPVQPEAIYAHIDNIPMPGREMEERTEPVVEHFRVKTDVEG